MLANLLLFGLPGPTLDRLYGQLLTLGYQVTRASSHTAALQAVTTTPHHLLLIDLATDRADSPPLAERLRGQHLPIIYLTTGATPVDFAFAAQTIPSSYLQPPVDDLLLKASIDLALQRYAAEQALDDLQVRYHMFETAIEHTVEAILITDAHMQGTGPRIVFANQAVNQLSGYRPEELIGHSPDIWHGPKTDRTVINQLHDAIMAGKPVSAELLHYRKDGSDYLAELQIVPLRDAQNEITHFVVTMGNITEKRREQEIRWIEQKLESLGALSGGVAHDFNNLLAVILGNTSLALLDLPPESPARAMLAEIELATQRATNLVRQLLTYAGKGRFATQPVALNTIIRELAPQLQALAGIHTSLQLQLAPRLPNLLADDAQLRQVLRNLVTNAAEAIGPRPGTITVATATRQLTGDALARYQLGSSLTPGEYVELSIQDTGSGMDAETRARMFDPFFSTKFAGRGLGLATVLGVVQGHSGALDVISAPEGGTTILVLLPASNLPELPAQPQATPPVTTLAQGQVLVVDDDDAVRTTAERILVRLGYQVLSARDGIEGVEIFRAHAAMIDCVLLDLTMPRMNGVEVFHAIRAIQPDAKIVLMSGYNEQEISARFDGLHINGFLPKPFTPSQLHERLQQALDPPEH